MEWNVDSWNALRGLPWDVTERGSDAAEVIRATRPQHVGTTSRGQTGESMVEQSVVRRVLTLLFMEIQQNLTQKSVGQGSKSKWSMILKVTNVCKFTGWSPGS